MTKDEKKNPPLHLPPQHKTNTHIHRNLTFITKERIPVVVVELHAFGAKAGFDAVIKPAQAVPARHERVAPSAAIPGLAEGAVGVVRVPPGAVAVGAEVVDGGVIGEGVGVIVTADAIGRSSVGAGRREGGGGQLGLLAFVSLGLILFVVKVVVFVVVVVVVVLLSDDVGVDDGKKEAAQGRGEKQGMNLHRCFKVRDCQRRECLWSEK